MALVPNTSSDTERQEDLAGHGVDRIGERLSLLERRRDIQNHDFVDPLSVVASGERCGVTGVAQSLEVDSLDHAAIADIEASDDPF